MTFQGAHTALITPFRDDVVDEDAIKALIDRQFDAGIKGVVPVGTTGESPTLSHDEHRRVIELSIEFTRGRGLVIAGTGSNSTREAIALTQAAEAAGADAALLVCPYYNKPSQEGLYQHYRAVAESTAIPLILYSIPGRSCIEISVETTARLAADCPNIQTMKEAGGSVERVNELREACPNGFEILSGDDSLTLPFMSVGAVGVISVAANLIPAEMVGLVEAALDGRWNEARDLHRRYYRLFHAFLKLDTNPVPIKAAMDIAGHAEGRLRRPLIPLPPDKRDALKTVMDQLGIGAA